MTSDDTKIEGSVTIGNATQQPAWIVAREDAAWLQSAVHQRPGTYPMTLNFHGREIDSGLNVTVGMRGELSFTAKAVTVKPKTAE